MANKLPLKTRITDVIHRTAVLSIVTFCVIGISSIGINVWINSDFSSFNKKKLKFVEPQNKEVNESNEKL